MKQKILSAGNLTAPYALSVRALHSDSDLLVALRLLVATQVLPTHSLPTAHSPSRVQSALHRLFYCTRDVMHTFLSMLSYRLTATPVHTCTLTQDEVAHYALAFRGQPLSARNERRWRVLLRQQVSALLRERVREYTSPEEDAAELEHVFAEMSATKAKADAAEAGTVELQADATVADMARGMGEAPAGGAPARASLRRVAAAIITRMGEKRLLMSVLEALDVMRAEVA